MNYWLVPAGSLSLVTLLAHVFGGGPEIIQPMFESELDSTVKAVLGVVWHEITFMLGINGVALIWVARDVRYQKPIIWLISCQYFAFAILFIMYGLSLLGSLIPMPQWSVFLVISALAIAGLKKAKHREVV